MLSRDKDQPRGGALSPLLSCPHEKPAAKGHSVTCPSLLRRNPDAAESLGEPSRGPRERVRTPGARLTRRLRRDDVLAQFTRFVLVGATSTATYAVFFVSLNGFGYLSA